MLYLLEFELDDLEFELLELKSVGLFRFILFVMVVILERFFYKIKYLYFEIKKESYSKLK